MPGANPPGFVVGIERVQITDPRTTDFARRHRDVIARFGRFPYRNAALGQVSGGEELAFGQTPGLTLLSRRGLGWRANGRS